VKDMLYRWPQNAALGRTIPKTKFYDHGSVRSGLRDKFVGQVQRIVWAYKLAEETIRLKDSDVVPEIQVFTVDTKGTDVGDDVLIAIDRTVHFPIIFEIVSAHENGSRVRVTAAQKQLSGTTPTVGTYFTTSWLASDTPRSPLPAAIDLPSLYEALLASLLPVAKRPAESVAEATDRIARTRKIEREIAALERKLRAEPQFNRKVELQRALRERQAALAEMT
jgi:hypothetical protein